MNTSESQRTKEPVSKQGSHDLPLHSVLVFLATTVACAIIFDLLPFGSFWSMKSSPNNSVSLLLPTPKYAVYDQGSGESHLRHVFNVLRRLGYDRVPLEEDWDLLWAHDYPFRQIPQILKNLQPHQVVNHLPGIGFISHKVDLSTTSLPFIPRAFRLPSQRDEFIQYARDKPTALFVEKHNEHRHIHIRKPSEISLDSNDSFVQEFVQNPFLVDGYKFDIGVYVVITSIDPLRVYMYTGDVLFRYCDEKYYPFDPDNVKKYIVGDDYLPTWEVPSLIKYYNQFDGGMRGAFDAYVRDQSLDPSIIWPQVERIIRNLILAKEKDIKSIKRSYKTGNFFELLRFDLIIDDQLRVHLMEANMSPNLSSAHFKPNSLLYEQVLYSVLNLVGIGSPIRRSSLKERDDIEEMITSEKNVAVNLNECVKYDCHNSCHVEECNLCLPCLSGMEYNILRNAHREHIHRTNMRRIFPKPILNSEDFDIATEVQNMTKSNKWMTRWFYAKCKYDDNWCL